MTARKKKKKISVYIIGRNCQGTLDKALRSVYGQSRPVDEVVYLDDGSDDASLEVAKSYAARGLIILHNETSKGIPASRNRAASACSGEWIAVLDADDCWHPKKIERQLAYVDNRSETGLLGTFARAIGQDDEFLGTILVPVTDKEIKGIELVRNCFVHSSVIFRRDAFEKVGGYADLPAAQDYDLMLRLSEICSVRNLPEILTDHRVSLQSISGTKHRTQRACALGARRSAYRRRGVRPGLWLRLLAAGHRLFLALVLFDPRIHWGAHQLLSGESAKGRDLLRHALHGSVRSRAVAAVFLSVPDAVYRIIARFIVRSHAQTGC